VVEQDCVCNGVHEVAARRSRWSLHAALFAIIVLSCDMVTAQVSPQVCGSLDNGSNGPFDYLKVRDFRLKNVETFHFTPVVEALIRGQSTTEPAGDLIYVLKAFPNHHRALDAMARLGKKLGTLNPPGMPPIECYFERALRFQPDDVVARMLYASFLLVNRRGADADKQLEAVVSAAGDNPFTHYNAGLIYFDNKNYDQALIQAHRAYGMGFGQTKLREQLQSVGKWVEPSTLSTTPNSASTSEKAPAVDKPKN